MVWLRATKSDVLTRGSSVFLGVSHAPIPRERGPSVSKLLWNPYAKVVWPWATKFGVLTRGSSVFLRVCHAPNPRGGTQHPPFFGTYYVRAHSKRNDNHILHGDQTKCEEFFADRPRTLTRDLFAVANLLVTLYFAFSIFFCGLSWADRRVFSCTLALYGDAHRYTGVQDTLSVRHLLQTVDDLTDIKTRWIER